MSPDSKKLYQFLTLILVLGLAPFVALYTYDPLQIFHKHWHSEGHLHGNMRQQAAGVINNYEFDSIILGTSMMKGSSALDAASLFGGNFVNLSADGSGIYERSLILKYALKHKNLKTVIFSLDTGLDAHVLRFSGKYPLKNFAPLYDDNPVNDLGIYWNKFHLVCLASWSKASECIGNRRSLSRESKWFEVVSERNKAISGVDNWLGPDGRGKAVSSRIRRHYGRAYTAAQVENRERLWQEIVSESFEPLIASYPEVNFKIVFPPYSRFLTALWKKHDLAKYQDYKNVITRMVDISNQYPNMEVYGFDDLAYVEDLNNYRDMRHYNVDMNKEMFLRMSKGQQKIDASNIQQYFEIIDGRNEVYDFESDMVRILKTYK